MRKLKFTEQIAYVNQMMKCDFQSFVSRARISINFRVLLDKNISEHRPEVVDDGFWDAFCVFSINADDLDLVTTQRTLIINWTAAMQM